jgi:2'-hydroxyisoflavone reductase
MGALVETLVERARAGGGSPAPRWIDEATLIEHGVTPWTELPLWIPAADAESAGFMAFSCARAIAGGLRIRPLAHTVDDTAAWLDARNDASAWRNVLSADRERELLALR